MKMTKHCKLNLGNPKSVAIQWLTKVQCICTMPRFLHLADVHLGFDRYDSKERTQDFYYAFNDALEKYAIAPQVDFVLIAGDLFEHRNIQPATLNQAQLGIAGT